METSWQFDFKEQHIEILPHLVNRDGLYAIVVNGIATQKDISLKEVVSWMANAMMNCKCK